LRDGREEATGEEKKKEGLRRRKGEGRRRDKERIETIRNGREKKVEERGKREKGKGGDKDGRWRLN
jgi:hypothetical protein